MANESKERYAYLEIEKETLEEMERKALLKEEATLLSLMDREADKEAEVEFEELQEADKPLVE